MKHTWKTKALALFLVLVMAFSMLPAEAFAAESVDESLVQDLANVYEQVYGDGDASRAREDLNALYEAGLIRNDGSLVDLDIRAGGAETGLDELSRRIAAGEDVGDITVNGHAATAEQIVKIRQVNTALELVRLMDEDVEISVVCGSNERMKKSLESSYGHLRNIHVLGYVAAMSSLYDSADLLMTKPGGISTTEAAVKALPMVLINAVAGCEAHNLQFFLEKCR